MERNDILQPSIPISISYCTLIINKYRITTTHIRGITYKLSQTTHNEYLPPLKDEQDLPFFQLHNLLLLFNTQLRHIQTLIQNQTNWKMTTWHPRFTQT